MNTVADRIKIVRGKMKPAEFARLIQTSPQNLYGYERGHQIPKEDTLRRICVVGKCTLSWLRFGEASCTHFTPHFRSVGNVGDQVVFLDSLKNFTHMTISEARAWLAANAELVDKAAQAIEAAAEYERQHRPQKPA